jgi:glycosyltransferase involved in cell wall biosynthesis
MGKEAPFFSIVIPTYNSAGWIVHSIRSALYQTYGNFEIIVVGDGCTDNTEEILENEFGAKVRWTNLNQNSGSQSAPNNEGISRARGSHVAYLGHDDIWSPDHLKLLARVVRDDDPDFAVSGAIYHGPPGSMFYQFTGVFEDSDAVRREFFPPSSFAHKRDLTKRIGPWRDPNEVRAPVDCEFLLRAADHGCRFKSSKVVSVHKFAAGHRYLSYRFPQSDEQENMLCRLREPHGNENVLKEIEADVARGATTSVVTLADFERFAPGQLYRWNRQNKGLDLPAPRLIQKAEVFWVDASSAALDWNAILQHPVHGAFRWSGPNPNPLFFLNVRTSGAVAIRIHVLGFGSADIASELKIDINETEVDFERKKNNDGSEVFSTKFTATRDGLLFRYRMPCSVSISTELGPLRAGLALSRIEIAPLPA